MKFVDTESLNLVQAVLDNAPPEYAIFSYTWSPPPSDKLTHCFDADYLQSTSVPSQSWRAHVTQACRLALAHNIHLLWVDNLCVDQTSSADVAESVIASFRLVWNASLCIVHLPDLPPATSDPAPESDLEHALSGCRWFTRSWTLQELVMPRRIEFFDQDWNLRGVKAPTSPQPWLEAMSRVSGVDMSVLSNRDTLFDISLGRRISWAAHRQANRPEDIAYALMGICGVGGRLAPRYGEGQREAFLRLQRKILKTTSDLSILAWKRQQIHGDGDEHNEEKQSLQASISGILADSPSDFWHFATNPALGTPFMSDCELIFSNGNICVSGSSFISDHLLGVGSGTALVLNASRRSPDDSFWVGISLIETELGTYVRANPWEIVCIRSLNEMASPRRDLLSKRHSSGKGEATTWHILICCDVDDRAFRRINGDQKHFRVSAWMDEVMEQTGVVPVQPDTSQGMQQYTLPGVQQDTIKSVQTDILQEQPTAKPREAKNMHHYGRARRSCGRQPYKRRADDMLEADDYSTDYCSEDDILLFDSLPERPERLPGGHPFQSVLHDLVTIGLAVWNESKEAKISHTDQMILNAATPNTAHPIFKTMTVSLRPRKRARRDPEYHARGNLEGQECSDKTDSDDSDLVIISNSEHQSPPDLFACPFYKLDPVAHHSCMWELELPSTRSIKQHVIVDHRRPEYCPVCYAVFDSAAARDQHIVARSCSESKAPVGLLVGVSQDQAETLTRRSNIEKSRASKRRAGKQRRNRSEENEWFRIWDVLFPGKPRPRSAYLSTPQERRAIVLRRFWCRKGPGIVAGELVRHGMQRWEDRGEEAGLAALHAAVLRGMMEELGFAVRDQDEDVNGGEGRVQ